MEFFLVVHCRKVIIIVLSNPLLVKYVKKPWGLFVHKSGNSLVFYSVNDYQLLCMIIQLLNSF